MSGRSPAGPLMHEHRIIERMLAVLAKDLLSIRTLHQAEPTRIDVAVDFIRTYADRCHHGKEEDILFARLADKDLDSDLAQAMAELIEDHAYGRAVTHRLAEANARYGAGETAALGEIDSSLQALIDFYPVHIEREDHHFFGPTLKFFTAAEQAQMLQDFDEFDRALIHAKYVDIVEGLEAATQ